LRRQRDEQRIAQHKAEQQAQLEKILARQQALKEKTPLALPLPVPPDASVKPVEQPVITAVSPAPKPDHSKPEHPKKVTRVQHPPELQKPEPMKAAAPVDPVATANGPVTVAPVEKIAKTVSHKEKHEKRHEPEVKPQTLEETPEAVTTASTVATAAPIQSSADDKAVSEAQPKPDAKPVVVTSSHHTKSNREKHKPQPHQVEIVKPAEAASSTVSTQESEPVKPVEATPPAEMVIVKASEPTTPVAETPEKAKAIESKPVENAAESPQSSTQTEATASAPEKIVAQHSTCASPKASCCNNSEVGCRDYVD
jgi:hypothetical protein